MGAPIDAIVSNQHYDTAFYPLNLRHIKTLFLRRQYRLCINASRQALISLDDDQKDHPGRNAFIHFYLGLAHDEFARALHEHSELKLPAFDEAEQHYREAGEALPTLQSCREALFSRPIDRQPEFQLTSESRPFQSAPERQHCPHEFTPYRPISPLDEYEVSPKDNLPAQSTPENKVAASDASDWSSHDSFNDIMTPHKILRRDISCMSLLDKPPLQRDYSSMSLLDVRPRLVKSTSQGLLRPIRPGSPPKQYHLPPKLPYVGTNQSTVQLPNFPSVPRPESPTPLPRLRIPSYEVSPVSPLGPEGRLLDMSTISPVSLLTPEPEDVPDSDASMLEPSLDRLEEHLEALHIQLQTHLRLLQHAKLTTTIAQAERAARSAPTVGTPLGNISNRSGIFGAHSRTKGGAAALKSAPENRLSQSRSFWSFTPVDVKAVDKQRRIEAGRARGWERQRFRPEKYQELADKALAEL